MDFESRLAGALANLAATCRDAQLIPAITVLVADNHDGSLRLGVASLEFMNARQVAEALKEIVARMEEAARTEEELAEGK